MVKIGQVGVVMNERLVAVPMTVRALWHRGMRVVVMPVIVAMGMLVLQCFVRMNMTVAFGGMQIDAREHEYRPASEPEAKISLAQHEGYKRANEGSDGKDRSGSCRTEGALREQVKA